MIGPWSLGRSLGRLLPPSVCGDDVHASVAVEIPSADSVLSHRPVARLRNWMYGPRLQWFPGNRGGPAHRATPPREHGVGNAIAIDIFEDRNLAGGSRHDGVPVPAAQFALRVYGAH